MKRSMVILCTGLLLSFSDYSFATPYHSTAQSKFGSSSIHFDHDYLVLSDHDDWYFGANNFTIDFWMKVDSFASAVNGKIGLFGQSENPIYAPYFHLEFDSRTGVFAFPLHYSTTSGPYGMTSNSVAWDVNQWYHFALVKYNETLRMYLNGESIGIQSAPDAFVNQNAPFSFGASHYQGPYEGYMEEIRVSNGIARWTENFTPPTEPYSVGNGIDEYVKLMIQSETYDHNYDFVDTSFSGHQISASDESSYPVPEPATVLLLGSGIAGLAAFRRRFRKS
jgi:hypothetical protein